MDPAAVLHVLVKVDGITRAHQQVRQLDDHMASAARTADRMDRDLGDLDGTLRKTAQSAGTAARAAGDSAREHSKLGAAWARTTAAGRGLVDRLRAVGGGGDDGGRGIRRFLDTMGDLPGRIFVSTRLLGALGNALLLISPVALAAGAAVFAIASALGPLIGLGAAAAGGLFALAQGFSVLKLATAGIGGALSEQIALQNSAGPSAVKSAGQQRAAAQAISAAQDGVTAARERVRDAALRVQEAIRGERDAGERLAEAQREAKRVQGDLTTARFEARRALEDMRSSLVDAAFGEQRATRALAQARQNLQDLTTVDVEVVARAHQEAGDAAYNEERAVRALESARSDLARLMGGADPRSITDAQEAVSDATRAEQRATLDLERVRKTATSVLESATASDSAKAAAALDLADAEDSVGDATLRRTDAEAALAKLQAGPGDAEKAEALRKVADAQRSVEQAQRATATATKAVQDASKGPSPQDIADGQLAIAEAENRLAAARRERTRLTRDLSVAEKAGVDGSDQVVAAQERIRDANRQVTDATRALADADRATADARRDMAKASRDVTKAIQAVRDAQLDARDSAVAAAAATSNLNDKFNALPPAAQEFVRVLIGLKPKMDELRATAAKGLFPGVTDGLRSAMGSFDEVNTVVGQTSTELGGVARSAGELVGSNAFGKDIETIGGRNAKILGSFGRSGLDLASALRHVLVAAGPLTTWMAKVIEKWSQGANEAARAGRETGKLAAFFDKTRDRARLLGSIIGNLASGLFGMGKASDNAGAAMLKDFDGLTERFSKWANSVKGRNEIAAFMDRVRDAMRDIGPGLGALIKAFANFAVNVLPAYARVMKTLAPVMDELVTIFIAWKIAATGAAIATGLWTVATTAQMRASIATTIATKAQAAAQWLLNAAMTANPIGLVVVALVAFVAAVVIAYKKSETFREIVTDAWEAIQDVAEAAWKVVEGVFKGIVAYYSTIFTVGKKVIGALVDGVKAAGGAIADAAGWVKDRIVDGIQAYLSIYKTIGGFIINRIVDGLKAVAGIASEVGTWVRDRVSGAWQFIANAAGNVGENIIQRIVSGVKSIAGIAENIGGWVRERVVNVWNFLGGAAQNVGENIMNRIVAGARSIADIPEKIGSFIRERIENVWGGVKGLAAAAENVGKNIGGAILDGVKAALDEGKSLANSIIKLLNQAIPDKIKIPGPAPDINLPNNPIPYLATGVRNFAGGLAVVGERGPELVSLPRGSDVYSNRETQGMLGAEPSGGGVVIEEMNVYGGQPAAKAAMHTLAHRLRFG